MKLKDIIENYKIIETVGSTDISIDSMAIDSRKVEKNGLFFAIIGTQADGHQYIETAIEKGAIAIICEKIPPTIKENICYLRVEDSAQAAGVLAHNFYGKPSTKLKLVGITGTNGKTTTTSMLYDIVLQSGKKAALLSTINNKINGDLIESTHTTPDAISLNALLAKAVEADCEFVFMEVSSHSIHQNRIAGLYFTIAAFTNITHDHLDYHNNFQEYLYVKKKFFDELDTDTIAIINADDKNGSVMVQNSNADVVKYSLKSATEYKAKVVESTLEGMLLQFNGKEFWLPLAGKFNAYNALLVFAILEKLGLQEEDILLRLSNISSVEGRFEVYRSALPLNIVVDYAHTPDALENVLENIKLIKSPQQQLFCVFGCGGNRDQLKRPVMGKIAALMADVVFITSDNPRNENPMTIIEQIEEGIPTEFQSKVFVNADRKQAIKQAIANAKKNDIILIAGKGHEHYQEIQGVKHPFNDLEVAIEITQQLKK